MPVRDRQTRTMVNAAVIVTVLTVATLILLLWSGSAWQRCLLAHNVSPADKSATVCSTQQALTGLVWLVVIMYVAVGVLLGLLNGWLAGSRGRSFTTVQWWAGGVIALLAVWVAAPYALGYGLGRLKWQKQQRIVSQLPPDPAPGLLAHLMQGGQPLRLQPPGFLTDQAVYFDAPLGYSRYYGQDVYYQPNSCAAFGSPIFVGLALAANAFDNAIARRQMQATAAAQWREHQVCRVILNEQSIDVNLCGLWISFHLTAIVECYLEPEALVLTFLNAEPLRLYGPLAHTLGVLVGYARLGSAGLAQCSYLHQLAGLASPQTTEITQGGSRAGNG